MNILADILRAIYEVIFQNPDYYPWRKDCIPPDGKSFDQAQVIGTPTLAAGETIVTQITCPNGYSGIVSGISNNFLGASFNPGLPSLIWRIRNGASIVNSLFVDNYSAITVEFGTTNQPRPIDGIFLSSGQTLLYTVTNNDPGLPVGPGTQIECCFSGRFWPEKRNVRGQGR